VALGPDDLVLCGGTRMAGPFREVVEAAVAGGFRGISLFPVQLERDREAGMTPADMRAHLRERGVEVALLEPILSWIPGEALPDLARALAGDPPEVFLDWAAELGAPTVLAVDGFGASCGLEALADSFARLCDAAGARGLDVALEFLPWSSLPDLSTASRLLALVSRPNAGLMIDAIHFHRGPSTLAQLAASDGARILGVQLCDAPARPVLDDLAMDSLHHRLPPGDGVIALVELVRGLDAAGYTGPIGVEVFSDALAGRPAAEVGRLVGDATRAVLARARWAGR